MDKLSICMAYHNRRQLLINTLKSIAYYNIGKRDFEIIIIDDGSDKEQRIDDLPDVFPELNIYTQYLDPKKKKYVNPCIPYNIAFSFATGDVILYQNTECLHVGDILGVIRQNSKKGTHLTFGVYSINKRLQDNINRLTKFDRDSILGVIRPMVAMKENWTDGDICWYNHSRWRPAYGSFIWSMMKSDLEDLNGFDERYAFGFAFDDAEFTVRLERKKMIIRYSDDPLTIHQYHIPSNYGKMKREYEHNRNIYGRFTQVEKSYKALNNNIYSPTR
jgi:glycosyltransferase involved in cell wall biosynthesis